VAFLAFVALVAFLTFETFFMNYILTVGLEIHIKLNTVNKMFCQCKNEQNFETLQANTNICPVCTGQP
jgi:Asp-tRNA(Asn)/Glu-tRNA(Gln) amidotransferase B subunit